MAKLYRIVELIEDHNIGKITIHSINTVNPDQSITDIDPEEGKLYYENFMVKYVSPSGVVRSIVDDRIITGIDYTDNEKSFNGRDNIGSLTVNDIIPSPSIDPLETFHIIPKYHMENYITDYSYIEDGLIKPGRTINMELIYGIEMGDIGRTVHSYSDGAYVHENPMSNYLGEGYVLNEDGMVHMNIHVPEEGFYNVSMVNGSYTNSGTINKVLVNNVTRYITSSSGKPLVWEENILKYQDYETQLMMDSPSVYLKQGKNTVTIIYDKDLSTKINVMDILVLSKDPNRKENYHEYQDKYSDGDVYGDYIIYDLDRSYIDNTPTELDSGYRLDYIKRGGQVFKSEDLGFYSNYIKEVTGKINYGIRVHMPGRYRLSITGAVFDEDYKNEILEIKIAGKRYELKPVYREGKSVELRLFNRIGNFLQEVSNVNLLRHTDIQIASQSDKSNYYLDSIVLDQVLINKKSNIFRGHEQVDNMSDLYMLDSYEDYNNYTYDNELRSRKFNAVYEYDLEEIKYKPISDEGLEPHEVKTFRYENLITDKSVDITVEGYEYLAKLLMINNGMELKDDEFGKYLVFRPYLYNTYHTEHFDSEGNSKELHRDNQTIIPLDEFYHHEIDPLLFRVDDIDVVTFISNFTTLHPLMLIRLIRFFRNI